MQLKGNKCQKSYLMIEVNIVLSYWANKYYRNFETKSHMYLLVKITSQQKFQICIALDVSIRWSCVMACQSLCAVRDAGAFPGNGLIKFIRFSWYNLPYVLNDIDIWTFRCPQKDINWRSGEKFLTYPCCMRCSPSCTKTAQSGKHDNQCVA